jgi:hypothetical protein
MSEPDTRSAFDFSWIVEAAGADERKLAMVSILIASFVMAREWTSEKNDPQVKHDLYQATLAMDRIGAKMNLPPSDIMKTFRDRVNDS